MSLRPGVLVLALLSSRLHAQAAPPTDGCGYDACALRQEGNGIRRGIQGDRVAKLGMFSATNLVTVVRGDSATAYARVFNREYRRGIRLTVLGFAAAEVPLLVLRQRTHSGHSFDSTDGALIGTAVAGLVVTHFGASAFSRARTAASKAIWWHNRGLWR